MMFAARQMQEKSIGQYQDLYKAFVNLTTWKDLTQW